MFRKKLKDDIIQDPIRDEVFSPERLELYASFLASELAIADKKSKGVSLLPRVKENEESIKQSYLRLSQAVTKDIQLSPAGEWIIDNYHIVEDQIREIKEDLPEKYYLELPKVKSGSLAGFPRVYAIALALVAHSDSHINVETVKNFVHAYQKVTPLLIGEIWAIPIALRITLIENLGRLSNQVILSQDIKEKIEAISNDIFENFGFTEESTKKLTDELSTILGKSKICDCSSISQLSHELHTRRKEFLPVCEFIDQYLAKRNLNIDEVVHSEHKFQASAQTSVSNAILSMKLLSSTDWHNFFESLSLVEPILEQDPVGAYHTMDFASRDQYRNAIERIHKKTGYGEINIAKEAMALALDSYRNNDEDTAKHHVGYYLVKEGIREIEKKIKYKLTIKEWIKRFILDNPAMFYLGLLIISMCLIIAPTIIYVHGINSSPLWPILIVFLTIIPASDSCLNLLNLFLTYLIGPSLLPKIDLQKGIPDNAKTFVVIPTIVESVDGLSRLFEDLEIRFLGNQDKNLFFAILSDYSDADAKNISTDEEVLRSLRKGIENLNDKYANGQSKFYLFHRERLWNPKENKWMGWERKRGKIHEFNRFLKQNGEASFVAHPVHTPFFSDIEYVITLDTDTKLPRNSARKLLGTILHPLNKPQFNEDLGIVTKGYSILQPRISINPESSDRSIFSKIFSGYTGIDPYTTAVSDSYQDLFLEGIYTGKGLYVVKSFERSLQNRCPENKLLSHDLFEGLFARAALVSDIEFLDDYPFHYESFAKRSHRWIRGDWQIINWIFSKVPDSGNNLITNPLSLISRWKIFDNLRRSLVAPTTLLWLILSWIILPGAPLLWTFIILTVLALPLYAHTASSFFKHPRNLPFTEHLLGILEDIKINLIQLGLTIITLPYQSYLHLDAIFRSLYRVFISKRNLLEWKAAAKVEMDILKGSSFFLSVAKYSWFFSLIILFFVLKFNPYSIYVAGIFLFAWFFSPFILSHISKEIPKSTFKINVEDKDLVREIAIRTWNFFENFVIELENWLPPDNFQQDPEEVVAHRTSPTNMGLYLLSCCSAYHFGYIGPLATINRLRQTLDVMQGLPRCFGHFYNWYDTRSLRPLEPEYVSTVDSGNLAGHLLAIKQACLEIREDPVRSSFLLSGLNDITRIIQSEIKKLSNVIIESTPNYSLKNSANKIQQMINSLNDKDILQCMGIFDELLSDINIFLNELSKISREHSDSHYKSLFTWSNKLSVRIEEIMMEIHYFSIESNATHFKERCVEINVICNDLFSKMDFTFLYDKEKALFSIGHNVKDGRNDGSYYDLLASEARLASFISIAKGDVPEKHWFHLGRQMTSLFRQRTLISWSASMFEYLMPLLVMKNYFGTLLSETNRAVVKQQISYANLKRRPWGVSESGFNARDLNKNYLYGPFGVPGLGLKRGLSDDFVVSPYSTALASLVLPQEAIENLKLLISQNFLTDFGFYEAIDYTEGRIPPKQNYAVIQNFMAHHQGMILVAFDNFLHDSSIVNYFHKNSLVKSSELLLQERVPKKVYVLHPRSEEISTIRERDFNSLPSLQHIPNVNTDINQTRVLSNGSYTSMLTATGSGFSKSDNRFLFKWDEDSTLEKDGNFVFVKNKLDGSLFSTTFQPLCKDSENFKTIFSEHKVEYFFENNSLAIHSEIIISAEDDVEMKKMSFSNLTNKQQSFDVISYAEPTLATLDEARAHPVFNKIFIETEFVAEKTALLAKRRRRSIEDAEYYGVHQIILDKKRCHNLQYETNRENFLGRKNQLVNADCLMEKKELSNTVGTILDPIFSFKTTVSLAPRETARIMFISGMASSRNEALSLIDRYHDLNSFNREDQMSWTQCQIELKHLNVDVDEANTFQKLTSALLYPCLEIKSSTSIDVISKKAQDSLWAYGISGDLPILLVSIKSQQYMPFIKDILQFHEYLRMKNIQFDLVFFYDELNSYRMELHEELHHQIRMSGAQVYLNKPGGIFLFKKDLIPEEDKALLESVSRVYFEAHHGSLKKQVEHIFKTSITKETDLNMPVASQWTTSPVKKPELLFYNGFGGFLNNGEEYQIYLDKSEVTPTPWINVIANSKDFGFMVSESGSVHTWSQNSRENRITPWSNDPVIDPSGEILYLLDEDTREFWTPTPGAARDDDPYLIRHGQGYTIFEHNSFGISQKITMYVSLEDEVKFVRVKLKNLSGVNRKLAVVYYLELVLGFHRAKTLGHIVTEKGLIPNSFLAKNHFDPNFGDRITFVSSNKDVSEFTCKRSSFIGRHGSLESPLALIERKFDGKIGVGLDPCFALKINLELKVEEEDEILFLVGQVNSDDKLEQLIKKNLEIQTADKVFRSVQEFWDKSVSSIKIKTPFPHFDILINRWLLYQTLSCRIWARTAFYQSGGAYGFRDQLQDVTSLLHASPEIAREHILKAAGKQFLEGDVLHWWHAPINKGVRTHFSDDLLWLPFVTHHYINSTGDEQILDQVIPFIEGPLIAEGEDDLYLEAVKSSKEASLYEHCLLALDYSLKLGKHDLPLMGSGDWNDGMNKVGHKGQGESVWLGMFLGTCLRNFSEICKKRGDDEKFKIYQDHLKKIETSLENAGWDGSWYRRAYFDDGTPLGSNTNEECQIDSIAQSWSVLSSLGSDSHRYNALESAKQRLVDEEEDMVYLFQPPFDKTPLNPGYIKGYPPGIRENGGQYTHAAIWLAMAFAQLKDHKMSFKIMDMLNPIKLSLDLVKCDRYKGEPYVVSADIYSSAMQKGKAGWTWYTGSSGWYYRAFIESILGIRRNGNALVLEPVDDENFFEYEVQYRFGSTYYNILFQKTQEKNCLYVDGLNQGEHLIFPLVDDQRDHSVIVKVLIN
ncbi:MAG: hypothetical protein K9K67_05785 [Bacteriovoracaceae bacterium]|nr:hypothetical protein [Bacteriovoracaceae bacterium]